MSREVLGYHVIQWGRSLVGLFLSFLLLYSGIGLLRVQIWARFASLAFRRRILPRINRLDARLRRRDVQVRRFGFSFHSLKAFSAPLRLRGEFWVLL